MYAIPKIAPMMPILTRVSLTLDNSVSSYQRICRNEMLWGIAWCLRVGGSVLLGVYDRQDE